MAENDTASEGRPAAAMQAAEPATNQSSDAGPPSNTGPNNTGPGRVDALKTFGGEVGGGFLNILKGGDFYLPFGIVAILAMLLIPLPSYALDVMLALSMTLAVIVLMTVIFVESAVELTAFPTILLVTTLLRLGLNVASTRLILSNGHTGTDAAGDVIQAFGNFVASGNYVIGAIVFGILVIINFIVITKGAGRIAEVAARFTLDAMPGKQMAIDADLSSGLISEEVARERRKMLEQESSFHGAMDGASKFVRGDAVAGLLITLINIVAGIIVGVLQRDMDLANAAQNYTLLTIGDGLVSQVPALIISVAAGILVTKSGIEGGTEKALGSQLSTNPMALGIASVMLFALAMVPGLPAFPFMLMFLFTAGIGGYLFYRRNQDEKLVESQKVEEAIEKAKSESGKDGKAEPITDSLQMDAIRIEMGYGLLHLVNEGANGITMTEQVRGLRRQLAERYGFVTPTVRILDNLQLGSMEYRILIKEIESGRGELRPNMLLCLGGGDGGYPTLRGEKIMDPVYKQPALWISENLRDQATSMHYMVIEPISVASTHLNELVVTHMPELLSYSATQTLLADVPESLQPMIKELVPTPVNVASLQKILQNLLREYVSIRDLPLIIESIADALSHSKNITYVTEHVRAALSRQICNDCADGSGELQLVNLSPRWEQIFLEALDNSGDGEARFNLPPTRLQEFMRSFNREMDKLGATMDQPPVLLVNPAIRSYLRSILERFRPTMPVLSQNEIHPKAKFRVLSSID